MLKLPQQTYQSHNQHKPGSCAAGSGIAKMQHPGLQLLASKMQSRLTNTNCEIEHDIVERFCERILPVTFLSWTYQL